MTENDPKNENCRQIGDKLAPAAQTERPPFSPVLDELSVALVLQGAPRDLVNIVQRWSHGTADAAILMHLRCWNAERARTMLHWAADLGYLHE